MLVETRDRSFHLTYCMNVHPTRTAADVVANVTQRVAEVRRRMGDAVHGPFAAGLYFGGAAAEALAADGFGLEEIGDALLAMDGYALTANAFPLGDFHGASVKESVYRPDWTTDERVVYSVRVGELMADLPACSTYQSVSTSPGSFREFGPPDLEAMAARLAKVAAEYFMIQMQCDRRVVLAIEPEPGCTFERIDELIAFYRDVLLARSWPALEALKPGNRALHEDIIRRHIGVCYDACHQAVEYEDARESLGKLAAAGVSVFKMQLSSAIEIEAPADNEAGLSQLAAFAEPRYLHQTVALDADGETSAFRDLPDYLAVARDRRDVSARVHFHVPLFLDEIGALRTTSPALRDALSFALDHGTTEHLEIETYSWTAMPGTGDGFGEAELLDGIAREYRWVLDAMGAREKTHRGE